MITSFDQLDLTKRYTYADYLTWEFKERVELIAGRIFKMSPAPSRRHQEVVLEIAAQLHYFLKGKPCQTFIAPFDVRFFEERKVSNENVINTVQPDLCVVCDQSKLDDAGCIGAPDLIVEIISPSSVHRDLKYKFHLYENHGVLEYWVIDPLNQTLAIHILKAGKYKAIRPYVLSGKISSLAIPGFELDLSTIFKEPEDWSMVEEPKAPYTIKPQSL